MATISSALLLSLLMFLSSVAFVVCKAKFYRHEEDVNQEVDEKLERSKAARHRALLKLQEVFGIAAPEGHHHPQVAPQFMVELYNTIADPGGVTHGRTPYNASVVRSFIERDNTRPLFFYFNISGLGEHERILEAELHLYRMRSPVRALHPAIFTSPNYLIRVYQVLDAGRLDMPDVHRLLNVHYVGAHASGWQVFNVKQAVLAWISGGAPNLGLLVTASTLFGDEVDVRFARRDEHHNSKQPILVLFDDDDDSKTPVTTDTSDSQHQYQQSNTAYPDYFRYGDNAAHRNEVEDSSESDDDGRRKRSVHLPQAAGSNGTRTSGGQPAAGEGARDCARQELYVDFTEIGWSSWIISPSGYSAYYCKGRCDFPLGQSQQPSNHATVQSIVHELGLVADVGKPCCVPSSLQPTSLLYLDENSNVILKLYEDMVAASCGCH